MQDRFIGQVPTWVSVTLVYLQLESNPNLSNMQPLLDNKGLGGGDRVFLRNTNVSCTDVTALRAKGVTVDSACA